MSVEKYKFISPGIFVSEIDNTGRTATPEDVGPAIIGRAEKGPILQPIKLDSFFDFVETFGEPIPGGGGGDVARNGNYTSPTYAAYAAQAWFRNNAPVTFVRLGGQASEEATTGGEAGWKTTDLDPGPQDYDNGGAFGLFVTNAPTQTVLTADLTCSADVLNANQNFRIAADGIVRTFTSGALENSNSTVDDPAMIFAATGSNAVGTHAKDDVLNKFFIAQNIATVINLSALPITANITTDGTTGFATSNIVQLTASGLTTLSRGIDIGYDKISGDTDFQLNTVGSGGGQIFMASTGTLSASYDGVSGTLAATWYIDQSASIALSGTRSDSGANAVGAGIYFDSNGLNEFKVLITSSAQPHNGVIVDTAFNFTDTSDKFIRKVFNTNPTLVNTAVVPTTSNSYSRYWLGESYEGAVSQLEGGNTGKQIAVILPLLSGSTFGGDFNRDYQNSQTGFFFAQDTKIGDTATGSYSPSNMQNLFKLVARNSGDYVSRNLKVSISNLRAAPDSTVDQPYGSFSVLIRKLSDTDNRINIVEQFNNCNLNPNSADFIGKKIGDKFLQWDDGEKRYREFGDYPNRSKYVYVEMPDEVKLGDTDPQLLPFGVRGPIQFKSFTDLTASEGASTGGRQTLVSGNYENFNNPSIETFISGATQTNGKIGFEFPQLRLKISASEGEPVDPLNSFFGVDTTFNSTRLNKSVRDHLKVFPRGVENFTADSSLTEISFNFTLDDICFETGTDGTTKFFAYKENARSAQVGVDVSARDGLSYLRGTGSYTEVLDAGVDKFTTVFAGGFDGLDITESEPLRQINYPDAGSTPNSKNNAVFNSVNVAIDSLRDPEVVEYNLAAMPGIVNSTLNTKLVDTCESRGDALAIIDLKGGFTPPEQSTLSADLRKGSVNDVVNTLKTDIINSSYAATYYPYVQIRDLTNGQTVTVPPSVPAIGALSYSQKVSELWFAPAGFTRGGLSAGRAGLPVVGVKDRLTSRDRDKLYENRINPIAQFPAEGIVIFGQKTLQIQGSALDRINVRRLMIFLKRQISRFAATILFDQNVRVTWSRFRGQVEPFLRGVQAGLGITEFKMVLDDTTTTPDLVDRNILYAKIFIKPARAIEFIAVDFILTDSGAAFED